MQADRVHAWLNGRALPLWAEAGIDRRAGGFVEALTLDGHPIHDVPKRMRVQARQIYVYAHAALLGWEGPWLETARHGFDFLTRHYWDADGGGWRFSVDRSGTPANSARETYEQAFALFALAWYYRASGDAAALDWIARTLDFIDTRLADPINGGYREALPDRDRLPRRQNPHMHLFEALLSLHWATGEEAYLTRARQIFELFRDRFFAPRTGTLGEFFTVDWQPAPGEAGSLVEPGHHFEWVWLLDQYGRRSGDDVAAELATLYQFAEQHGVDRADGLAFDAVRRDGATHDDNKRLWVQTEAIKAQVARCESFDDQHARNRLDQLVNALFDTYLVEDLGTWQDHVRRDRTGFAPDAPASTFYHLFLALTEVLRLSAGQRCSPFVLD